MDWIQENKAKCRGKKSFARKQIAFEKIKKDISLKKLL